VYVNTPALNSFNMDDEEEVEEVEEVVVVE